MNINSDRALSFPSHNASHSNTICFFSALVAKWSQTKSGTTKMSIILRVNVSLNDIICYFIRCFVFVLNAQNEKAVAIVAKEDHLRNGLWIHFVHFALVFSSYLSNQREKRKERNLSEERFGWMGEKVVEEVPG